MWISNPTEVLGEQIQLGAASTETLQPMGAQDSIWGVGVTLGKSPPVTYVWGEPHLCSESPKLSSPRCCLGSQPQQHLRPRFC